MTRDSFRTPVLLGSRWFLRSHGASRALIIRRVVGLFLAVLIGLVALALWQANGDRAERGRGQEPRSALGATPAFKALISSSPYRGDAWTTVFVNDPQATAPTPPGLPRFPQAGETWVSPAVATARSTDRLAAKRIPGRVVGIIGDEGLQSPDQYFVYSGSSKTLPTAFNAGGWGATVPNGGRATIPQGPLAGILATLLGLPILILLQSTSRLSAESRRRDLAAMHLLGVPGRTLGRASAVEAMWCCAVASALGVAIAATAVKLLAPSHALGISWFPPPTGIEPLSTVVVVTMMSALVVADAARSTRRGLGDVLISRAGGPKLRGPLRIAPLIIGTAMLLGVVLPHAIAGQKLSSGSTYVYFLVGTFLASLGAVIALGPVLRAIARLGPTHGRGVVLHLALRRLNWDSDAIARSVSAVLIVTVCGLIGSGAIADIARLSPDRPAGHRYTVPLAGATPVERQQVMAVPAPIRVLQVDDGDQPTWVGSCHDLGAILALNTSAGQLAFEQRCRDGQTYSLIDPGHDSTAPPVNDEISVPGLSRSDLGTSTVIASSVSDYAGNLDHAEFSAYPGRSQRAIDDFASMVVAAWPHAFEILNTTADSFEPMIAPTKKMLLACVWLGLSIAMLLVGLTAIDSFQRNLAHGARLIVIGAPQSLSARVHTLAVAIAALVCLALASTIGWLAALTYDLAGGTGATPGALGWLIVGGGAALGAAGVLITWVTTRRRINEALPELLQRE